MTNMIKLNPAAARAADYTAAIIDRSGKYIGVFTDAYINDTPSGASFVNFQFRAEDGATCRIQLCIRKKDGTEAFGNNIFNAVLTCLRLSTVALEPGLLTRKDGQKVQISRLPVMLNRPIGVLLQRVRDEGADPRYSVSMDLRTPFEAATGLVASEILDKAKDPRKLTEKIGQLTDERVIHRPAPAAQPGRPAPAPVDDSDVPF